MRVSKSKPLNVMNTLSISGYAIPGVILAIAFITFIAWFDNNFVKLFGHNNSVAKDLNLNLNQRPEELSNEMFYKIAAQYEKLFD